MFLLLDRLCARHNAVAPSSCAEHDRRTWSLTDSMVSTEH